MHRRRRIDPAELATFLQPRTQPIEEVEVAPGVFHQLRGPCRTYERIVTPARVPDIADEAVVG